MSCSFTVGWSSAEGQRIAAAVILEFDLESFSYFWLGQLKLDLPDPITH